MKSTLKIFLTIFFAATFFICAAFGIALAVVAADGSQLDYEYHLVSKKRVGRTIYEYTYKVTLLNNGPELFSVKGEIKSDSANTEITDGNIFFGDLPSGQTVTPVDTISFRQDRRYRFNPASLTWDFQFEVVPDCDPNNPEVQIIQSADDWQYINDGNKRIFCVNPGDYSDLGAIEITSSGTEQKRRFLLLNNPNNDHPAKLVDDFRNKDGWLASLAKYRLKLNGANYWTIDRLAYWEDDINTNFPIMLKNSSHNIFDRILIVDTTDAIRVRNHSNSNIFKRMHIEKTQWAVDHYKKVSKSIITDDAAILLGEKENVRIINNRFEDNEIINYVDPIQLTRDNIYDRNIDFAGTKIIGNTFYVTPIIYTDCNGTFNTNGSCSLSENAIDLKAGSHDPNNPIIIKNNVMFGYKTADYNKGSDPGSAIVLHYHIANVVIENNLIFKSVFGINSGDPLSDTVALENVTIKKNIFYHIGIGSYKDKDNDKQFDISLVSSEHPDGVTYSGGKNIHISENTFADEDENSTTIQFYDIEDAIIEKNLFIHNVNFWIPKDFEGHINRNILFSDNTFYTYSGNYTELGDIFWLPDGHIVDVNNTFIQEKYDLHQIDQTYITRKFTGNPQEHHLIN